MEILQISDVNDYELIDSGDQTKLERFGKYITSRPDPNALWSKDDQSAWQKADAIFHPDKKPGQQTHWENKNIKNDWIFSFDGIKMVLKMTPFKHTGLFPEQISNWRWFGDLIKKSGRTINILNLFGYTGGATLYAAKNGAQVTHIDASKPAVSWAGENQKLSGLEDKPIRWIIDDAKKFITREVKRGAKYDAIIMDPPSFGRDPKGKVFKFENDVPEILKTCKQLLSDKPLFFLINSYSLGYSPTVIKNMLGEILPLEKIKCGELQILEKNKERTLPCSVFARFEN